MHDVPASPDLRFSRTDVSSSESPHASANRSGRVAAAPRAYTHLVAVRRIDDGPVPTDIPHFIDVPPRRGALVVERLGPYDGRYEVRTATGELTVARRMSSVGAHVLARDEGCFAVGQFIPWTDRSEETAAGENLNQGESCLPARSSPGRFENWWPVRTGRSRIARLVRTTRASKPARSLVRVVATGQT